MRVAFQRAGRGGFTLIELMVVLLLMAVLTGVMVAEMRGTFEDALLRSSARELISACQMASSRAVTINQPHTLVIEDEGGAYAIERIARDQETGGRPRKVRDVPGGEGTLDERITVQIHEPEMISLEEGENEEGSAGSTEPAGMAQAITFYPDGTADPREILLRDRAGFELALRINPATARVRVERMVE